MKAIRRLVDAKPFFDQPQRLKCISLVFEENETAQTQEFVLRWSPDEGSSVKEIVRQQWNFSPQGSIREVEEYRVELSTVTVLEFGHQSRYRWRTRSRFTEEPALVLRRVAPFKVSVGADSMGDSP